MTCAAATFPGVTAFDCRAFDLADCLRAIRRGVVISFGTVTVAGATGAAVTVIAAWIIATVFGANPGLKARTPLGLETAALITPYGRLAGTTDLSGLAGFAGDAADVADAAPPPSSPIAPMQETKEELTVALAAAPASIVPLPPRRPSEQASDVPLPQPRPLEIPPSQAQHDMAGAAPAPAPPQVADASPPPAAPAPFHWFERRVAPPQGGNSIRLSNPDSRTALYDIEAHTVYLPNGEKLEAHSGLGRSLDDPRHVNEKARGPTPPNVYDLVLRDGLFHGVRAIRLNPVDDDKMFGRDGILAHTYMLGPTGQSFGCVSFKNYQEFLQAFLRGEIDRLVVVPHLEAKPADQRARRGDAERYAFNNR